MALPASSSSPARGTGSLAALQALVKEDLAAVNRILLASVDDDVALIRNVAEHIIASGGKRLRPSLTLACAALCEYRGTHHQTLAAAVELIHTATLLHDDVVDESTLRRGSETANAIWSNQSSVLVGDFMLSRAFQLMVGSGSLPVLHVLSDASATISKGEVMQLVAANDPATTESHYLAIIKAKTSALFAAATELGAIISEREQDRAALRSYGEHLGIAFQLVDDALDYAADSATLGKTVGDDFREGKITLPVILAYRESSETERAFWHRTLEQGMQQEGDLAQAMSYLARYQTIARTLSLAEEYALRAEEALQGFADSAAKQALLETARFCCQRSY